MIKDKILHDILTDNVTNILEYLIENQISFSILCDMKGVSFNPILPEDIMETFKDITLFTLGGYTLSTAHIQEESIIFEAGFGKINFGSIVTVKLEKIIQVLIEDNPLAINITATLDFEEKPKEEGISKSFEALLNNPENKKLLK